MLSLKEIGQFQKIVGGLIELVDQLAKEAENEKMKVRSAVGLDQEPCVLVFIIGMVVGSFI